MASNLLDLIHLDLPMLVLYGTDHVTARARTDGGQKRDQPFLAMALRLRQAGVKVFLVVTIPLAGASSWRGNQSEILWTGADGHLSSGRLSSPC